MSEKIEPTKNVRAPIVDNQNVMTADAGFFDQTSARFFSGSFTSPIVTEINE